MYVSSFNRIARYGFSIQLNQQSWDKHIWNHRIIGTQTAQLDYTKSSIVRYSSPKHLNPILVIIAANLASQ